MLILLWFATQLFSGWAALTETAQGGIGWWAHIGGFLTGIVLLLLMGGRRNLRPSLRREAYPR